MGVIYWKGQHYQQVVGPLKHSCDGCIFNTSKTRTDCVAFREMIPYTDSCLDDEATIYILNNDLEVEFKSIDE